MNGGIYVAIAYQKDMRSGIIYAYDSKSHWNKEKQQSRSTRHLIGRVDPLVRLSLLMGEIERPKSNRLKQTETSRTSITVRLICSPS